MYMFFWFFKQLYYCLKRIFKKGLLLLFIFFIIFMIFWLKKTYAATTNNINCPEYNCNYILQFNSIPSFTNSNFGSEFNPSYHAIACVFYNYNNTVYASFYRSYQDDHENSKLYLGTHNNNTTVHLNGSWDSCIVYKYLNNTWTYDNWYNLNNSISRFPFLTDLNSIIYSTHDIYTAANSSSIYFHATVDVVPYITTSENSINNWSFENLEINCGSIPTNSFCELQFYYENTLYYLDLTTFKSINNGVLTFTIPKANIGYPLVIRNGSTFDFQLLTRQPIEGGSQVLLYELGDYTLNITTTEEEQYNDDSNKQLINSIYASSQEIQSSINQQTQAINEQTEAINEQTEAINEQTDAINEQTDYLQDDTINNNSIYLPQDNTNDITSSGINNIFNDIYNAFCTGQAQDIVFPIPFTSKSITLSPNYLYNMLSNYGATWIITIIQAFYWYIISRFIVKDILNKITKIKSGNLEGIETTNIKGDML